MDDNLSIAISFLLFLPYRHNFSSPQVFAWFTCFQNEQGKLRAQLQLQQLQQQQKQLMAPGMQQQQPMAQAQMAGQQRMVRPNNLRMLLQQVRKIQQSCILFIKIGG